MRVLAINHQRDAGPGVFADAIQTAGCELEQWFVAESTEPPADPAGYDAAISFGGAMHADQEDLHPWLIEEKALLRELHERGTPLLGVCLGAQLLAEAMGGKALRAAEPEIGWVEVELTPEGTDDPVMAPLAPGFEAFAWHSYECVLPPDASVLARTPVCVHAYRLAGATAWGIQFHAEVSAADALHWIDEYGNDPDAFRIGLDPEALRQRTLPRLDAWNALGRELCRRFLAVAATRAAPSV